MSVEDAKGFEGNLKNQTVHIGRMRNANSKLTTKFKKFKLVEAL